MELIDLLELYKQGKYEEVIEQSKDVNDFNAIFLRIRSYFALNRYVEALNDYKTHESIILKGNFVEAIKLYISILIKLNYDVAQILLQIGPYYEYPSLSKESQDFLMNIREFIESESSKSISTKTSDIEYDDKTLISMLEGNNAVDMLQALAYIKLMYENDEKLTYYFDVIKKHLHSLIKFDLHYAILFNQLILIGDDDSYLFVKDGIYYQMSPKSCVDKLNKSNSFLTKCFKQLDENKKDIVINECLTRIFFMSYVYLAPTFLATDEEAEAFFYAGYTLALRLLGKDNSEIEKYNLQNINFELVSKYTKYMEAVSKDWNANTD